MLLLREGVGARAIRPDACTLTVWATETLQVGGWGEPQGKGFYLLEDGSKHEGEVLLDSRCVRNSVLAVLPL